MDRLTGLPGRAWMGEALARQQPSVDLGSVLCVLDLDQLRFLNLIAGTEVGDIALRDIAALLKSLMRVDDLIARTGDDEFSVVFVGCDLTEARGRAADLLAAVSAYHLPKPHETYSLTASAGLMVMAPGDAPRSWLTGAVAACTAAKDLGRGRLVFAGDAECLFSHQEIEARILMGLKSAIADDRLQLYAQEIICFDPLCTDMQFEVLVHMVDRDGTKFLPASVIPAAERHGYIRELDRWVMKAVLVDCAAILHGNPKLCLSLNLSGQSLGDPGLWPYIAGLFEKSGVPGHRIQFEITETSAISDMAVALAFVTAARGHGCRVALDDFGSGLSSFLYLRTFPVDCIKIDGAFVGNVTDPNSIDRAIVRAIVGVAHDLGLDVVAEHVDSTGVLKTLGELGVDMVQGFLIAQPRPFLEMFK